MDSSAGRGVVFGPYEAYCAELMWFRDVVADAHLPKEYGPNQDSPLKVPTVAWQMKRRILEAGLLYGQIDTSAAGVGVVKFIDAALFKNGMYLQPETWEVDLSDRWRESPFKRSGRERGILSGPIEIDGDAVLPIEEDAASVPDSVIYSVERYLRRVGFESIAGMDIRSYAQTLRSRPWPPVAGMDPVNALIATTTNRSMMAAMGVHAAVGRSVEQEIPFFSQTELAPAWIQTGDASPQFEVVRAALDIPGGPTLPSSIRDLSETMGDPSVIQFREFVSWATNRVLTTDTTAIREVQREVRRVSARRHLIPKAGAISRMVTYIAVPLGAAEVLYGVSGPGLAMTGAGALSQSFASILTRIDREHWITLK